MILIVVKFTARPEHADQWMSAVREFTEATRAEPGNLWFEWSRSVENPNQFVLVEAFRDGEAGAAHVGSDHFPKGLDAMRPLLAKTPEIINVEVPGDSWSQMGELAMDDQ